MASLTEDQLKVKELLADSVMFLCRQGIKFTSELRVEGLIGITVDNNQILLVNINEAIKSARNERDAAGSRSSGIKRRQSSSSNPLTRLDKAAVEKCLNKLTKKSTGDRRSERKAGSQNNTHNDVAVESKKSTTTDSCDSKQYETVPVSVKRCRQSNSKEPNNGDDNCEQTLDMAVEDELLGDMSKCVKIKEEPNTCDLNETVDDENIASILYDAVAVDEADEAEAGNAFWLTNDSEPGDQSQDDISISLLELKGQQSERSGPPMVNQYLESYTCPHCGLIVRTSVTLRDHVAGKHGDSPRFVCSFCGKRFKWRSTFFYHRKSCNPAVP